MKFTQWRGAFFMLALVSSLGLYSCKRDAPKDATMVLQSFNPEQGSEGGVITLTGRNFSSSKEKNIVKFNGVEAIVSEASGDGTSLTVIVPENATTGKISVKTGDQEVVSAKEFTVNPLAPAITGFTPDHGPAGTVVVITGKNFVSPAKVIFGELEGVDVVVVSKTRIEVKAPADLLNGKITVECNGLKGVSAGLFYAPLAVTTIEPKKAEEDSSMVINGSNFDVTLNNNIVKFGTAMAEVVEATSTKLKVKVPAGAANGKISVTVNNVTLETSDAFTILPTIVDYAPKHGEPGSTVVVTGKNFSSTAIVRFGARNCTVTKREANAITVTIPSVPSMVADYFSVWNGPDMTTNRTIFEMTNIWRLHSYYSGKDLTRAMPFQIGNKLYVFGGWGLGWYVSSFDVTTKSWGAAIAFPEDLQGGELGSVVVHNGKAYMGNFVSARQNYWYEFNPAAASGTSPWKRMAISPNPSAFDGIALNVNNRLFHFLGAASTAVNELNPAANGGDGAWTHHGNAAVPNKQRASGFVINGIGYFGGGVDDNNVGQRGFYKYDPATNAATVTPIAEMLFSTENAPTFTMNGKGYLIDNQYMYEYDPALDKWTQNKFVLPATVNFTFVVNNKAYAMDLKANVYEYIPNR